MAQGRLGGTIDRPAQPKRAIMLRRIWYFLTDSRNLTIIGFVALAAFFYLGAEMLELALIWAIAAMAACLVVWLAVWGLRRALAARQADRLAKAMESPPPEPGQQQRDDIAAIRETMVKAIGTIRQSKLGIVSGTRALYELPWYQVFDKGFMEDAEGRVVDFRNTVIIMTSNLGSAAIMQACLNKPQTARPTPEDLDTLVRPHLVRHFKPAFLGRVEVVPFYPLGDDVLAQIIALKLGRIAQRVNDNHHAEFGWDDALLEAVLARCTEVDSGARNVDSILNGTLLPDIADAVLARMAEGAAVSKIKASANRHGQFKLTIK
jgi:hypothetical protein